MKLAISAELVFFTLAGKILNTIIFTQPVYIHKLHHPKHAQNNTFIAAMHLNDINHLFCQ